MGIASVRLTKEIFEAVRMAVNEKADGSGLAFSKMAGVSQSLISKCIREVDGYITPENWEKLRLAIAKYLPKENQSSYLLPVYSQSGDYLGDWPAIPGAEFSILVESDTFIESLPINCLAVLGSILEPVRGELISTADTPYQFGRYQISILPKTSYRKVVNITIFPGGNPKKYLIKK